MGKTGGKIGKSEGEVGKTRKKWEKTGGKIGKSRKNLGKSGKNRKNGNAGIQQGRDREFPKNPEGKLQEQPRSDPIPTDLSPLCSQWNSRIWEFPGFGISPLWKSRDGISPPPGGKENREEPGRAWRAWKKSRNSER